MNAAVLSEFLGRAAQQYASAQKSTEEEPYLDGLGLYLVAKQRADRQIKELSAKSADAAKKVQAALAMLAKAILAPGRQRASRRCPQCSPPFRLPNSR